MSIKTTIAALTGNTIDSAEAARKGLYAAQDVYHLQRGIRDHGEHAMLNATVADIMKHQGCTLTEAAGIASQRMIYALELVAGQPTFQSARRNLDKDRARKMSAAASNFNKTVGNPI